MEQVLCVNICFGLSTPRGFNEMNRLHAQLPQPETLSSLSSIVVSILTKANNCSNPLGRTKKSLKIFVKRISASRSINSNVKN